MKIKNLNEWFTLVANIAVFTGIIFLAIEINQTNELMAAEERFNRLTALTGLFEAMIENSNMAEIYGKALITGEELSPGERIALDVYLTMNTRSREWTFKELEQDELPINYWKNLYRQPFTKAHSQRTKSDYDPLFTAFIEREVLDNN